MFLKMQRGDQRTQATRTGCQWFLILNVVYAVYLVIRLYIYDYDDIHYKLALLISLIILSYSLFNFLLGMYLSQSDLKLNQWALIINALIYGLLWSFFIEVSFLAQGELEFIITLSFLIFFPASITLFLSPVLFFILSSPVFLTVLANIIAYGDLVGKDKIFILLSYISSFAVIYTVRFVLLEWFLRAENSEKVKVDLIIKLNDIANKDGLTGLYNKRFFRSEVEQRLISKKDANSTGDSYLIILDVDFFKSFNDIYGHMEGDKCLSLISSCINESIRKERDLAARFGGEEFIVFMSSANFKAAYAAGRRIQEKIEQRAIKHSGSTVSPYVTVSVGIAKVDLTLSLDENIKKADKQLYVSKLNGRNSVNITQD
ncbi:TPA: membrane-associated sensor domain-containing protein [Salmonella enterica subsp. enterica serovar Weltevreden]|nr:membrane-associated sensor domain-containing protein [Salmonella enterica subsp. enterica serovar Weltevreden]HEC6213880.1 membrane-associated sensor domain-containing protein [Salmonella enterica subsp. enterica serovar Weltevreden]